MRAPYVLQTFDSSGGKKKLMFKGLKGAHILEILEPGHPGE